VWTSARSAQRESRADGAPFLEDNHVAEETDALKKIGSIARRDRRDNPETYARSRGARVNATPPAEDLRPVVGPGQRLALAMGYDDSGRLVICPDGRGGHHVFWKWHAGRHAGHYVYWRVWEPSGLVPGLEALSDRYEEVLAGIRRPIKDTPRPE
jgi:hypothetical protein